ncbi:putative DNA binding domain-containing protein [Lachnospiraceae bacterium DSM 108991]|uniref:DNA binding domain-containing protein n=1 Tax=Claveliimonas monacensis TaxID=2779351 RepID=A0ABR9RKN8_9FIRM|nr:ATP-binding protein [Claveliimonas monacensis]MBE5063182.1 putative DNA binding domain-containing protein [Claveliimonas monacensis]
MKFEDFQGIEATHLDYKVSLEKEKPKSWLKSVVAFANTKGGHILFGVTNNGHDPIGLDDAQSTASKISELLTSRVEPPVRYTLTPFSSRIDDRLCIDLEVANGPHYPYYYVHEKTREIYVRRGDRSEIATVIEQNNLILKGMNKTYDSLPSSYNLSDVSFTLLAATFKKETGDDFDLTKDLVSMGFVTEDGIVTNAGLLLCDQGYLKQSKVVCTRWKGIEKGSVEGDALDDEEFTGVSLITLLANAEAFIRTNSKSPWSIRGMRREEKSDYPFKAVREVLVNALIHRDYQSIGAEVHVDMYDDRMEISSPGGMINGSRIQDLDLKRVPSMRRNEIISDTFGRLHYMERRGSGIRRILNSYVDYTEQPEFYSDEYFFIVTLPNRSEARSAQLELKLEIENAKPQQSSGKLQQSSDKPQLSSGDMQLSSGEKEKEELKKWLECKVGKSFNKRNFEKLLELLGKYGSKYCFNRTTIANTFGISENTASRIIRKSMDCGIMRKEKNGEYYFNM